MPSYTATVILRIRLTAVDVNEAQTIVTNEVIDDPFDYLEKISIEENPENLETTNSKRK